jgi:RimJ/RimL family protein N-acetyltransferase
MSEADPILNGPAPRERHGAGPPAARLVLATDAHFAWLLGEGPALGLTAPASGLDEEGVLVWVRALTARLRAAGLPASWLVVDVLEVVGLCSFKDPPDGEGSVEIGYSVAPSRRGRGYATAAVALVCLEASRPGRLRALRAETSVFNPASHRVLERNGFERVGAREDAEEGPLLLWRKSLVSG